MNKTIGERFLIFDQILIDNHKQVMISFFFFFAFLKYEKDVFFVFLIKSMLRKLLGFGHMHENKKKIVFLEEIDLKILRFFLILQKN
jgi:hypothetical protein